MNESETAALFTDEFGPWKVIVTRTCWHNVYGSIYYGGVFAGTFERWVHGDRSEVKHDGLYLKGPFKGRGFGRQWIDRCMDRYRAAGLATVKLIAVQDGRFVWRKLGYTADVLDCEHSLNRAACDARAILNCERTDGPGLSASDDRRFAYFARSRKVGECTVWDFLDWKLNDGRTIADLLKLYGPLFRGGAMLSWNGTLAIGLEPIMQAA